MPTIATTPSHSTVASGAESPRPAVSDYWVRRQQTTFVATMNGVFADNALAVGGGGTHVQDDMTVDISGGGYTAGVTDFSAEAFIDALRQADTRIRWDDSSRGQPPMLIWDVKGDWK